MKSLILKTGDAVSVNDASTISKIFIPAATDARERKIRAMLTHDNLSEVVFDGESYSDLGDPLIDRGFDGKRSVMVLTFAAKERPENKAVIFEELKERYDKQKGEEA